MGGLRLGWMYGPPAIVDVMNRLRSPFSVSSAAQAAGVAALEDTGFIAASRDHNTAWLPWLAERLAECGLTVHPSVANFVLVRFPADTARNAAAAAKFLAGRGIIARETKVYKLPDCLRITVGTEPEMRALTRALADFMAGETQ